MINPKELMVDNWVESYYVTMGFGDGKDGKRSLGHKQMTGEWIMIIEKSKIAEGQYLATCDPIPITEEILAKCGFESCSDDGLFWHKEMNSFTLQNRYLDDSGFDAKLDKWEVIPIITSLHQLQNLYFSLTGDKLIYTP